MGEGGVAVVPVLKDLTVSVSVGVATSIASVVDVDVAVVRTPTAMVANMNVMKNVGVIVCDILNNQL